jgi:hypothetical protein
VRDRRGSTTLPRQGPPRAFAREALQGATQPRRRR